MITIAEFKKVIYPEAADEISRNDDADVQAAIDCAVDEARGYLAARYDVALLFQLATSANYPKLKTVVGDIAAYHFIRVCNVTIDYEVRMKRYDDAIEYLESVQKGKINPPAWPLATLPTQITPGMVNISAGSQKRRQTQW